MESMESMESPWRAHGESMNSQHSMCSAWILHGLLWILHGFSMFPPMVSPWVPHGLSMYSAWSLRAPWTCHGLSIWILNMKSPYGLSMWTLHMDPPWTLHGLSMDSPWPLHGLSMDSAWIPHGLRWTIYAHLQKNEAHRGILAGRAGTPSMEGAHGHSCARIPGKTLPEQGMGHAFWPQSPPPTVLAVSRAVFWVNIRYYFKRNPG